MTQLCSKVHGFQFQDLKRINKPLKVIFKRFKKYSSALKSIQALENGFLNLEIENREPLVASNLIHSFCL